MESLLFNKDGSTEYLSGVLNISFPIPLDIGKINDFSKIKILKKLVTYPSDSFSVYITG